MTATPRSGFDSTRALLGAPYDFIQDECRRHRSDVFQTRILLRRTLCMTGRDAARLFYDTERFQREGAAPRRIRRSLFGTGSVQGMDGEAHRHRKAMFMALMTPEGLQGLEDHAARAWHTHALRWPSQGEVVLYDEAREVLTRAVCAWAGVPLPEDQVAPRARTLAALYEGAGAVGPVHWRARRARGALEWWATGLVEDVRAGRQDAPAGSALRVLADHQDLRGEPLDARVAAVELLNVLRPTVAVSVYVALAAHALHREPAWRERLAGADDAEAGHFVEEVRRYYPFFPAVAARVRHDFEWGGHRFQEGTRVLLDLHGTNHDLRHWTAPDSFRPERFAGRDEDPFGLVPQGGGDPNLGHRCAGEPITLRLVRQASRFLARDVEYEVPPQDLDIDRSRMPALPRSRVVLSGVRYGA